MRGCGCGVSSSCRCLCVALPSYCCYQWIALAMLSLCTGSSLLLTCTGTLLLVRYLSSCYTLCQTIVRSLLHVCSTRDICSLFPSSRKCALRC